MQIRVLNTNQTSFVEVHSFESSVGNTPGLGEHFDPLACDVHACDSQPSRHKQQLVIGRNSDSICLRHSVDGQERLDVVMVGRYSENLSRARVRNKGYPCRGQGDIV